MAAYLADDDAEVYNLTDAVVRQDALGAALNLTALAAEAVADLAASQGVQPGQALRALTADRLEASPEPAAQITYPTSMDDYDWEMAKAKGWIEVTVRWADSSKAITIYDPVRLAQEVADAVAGQGYFAESAAVVVPAVTKEAVEDVIAQLARKRFTDVVWHARRTAP
ncbi:hypothetical protein BJ973_002060 [Actinoplanes tereljensis]|uniref:Uncharacterized protein n=1 Tax=Paractinoplanes tereljensis TaxID=571912 RepID=A0A919NJU0_9ACTN|nr:hypothetical protein [Actinoplanes tereljensis]GIF20034.1 hypothetical protein Ate02nite_27640 [Actinoplanes tereljensis]